jgi:cytochrome c oxidase subunit 2
MWNFPLLPDQASSSASKVDGLMLFELAIISFFTLLILVLVVAFAIRYRRGSRADRSHPPTHSKQMEAVWIGIPFVLSMVMFAWSAQVFYDLYRVPGDAYEVYVVGKQWMWYLQHPQGRKEINELHVPLGRPVKLKMTSQDVIHSFFIPAFRTKQDVLPGRYTEMWFEPTKPGKYRLFCTEYCGTNHSTMGGWVYVMEPEDYEAWLVQGDRGPTLVDEGKQLFVQNHCAGCHGPNQSVKAPRLEGVYGKQVPIHDKADPEKVNFVLADDRYIIDSIKLPQSQIVAGYGQQVNGELKSIMPSYQDQISEADLLKILAYIKSIGGEAAR